MNATLAQTGSAPRHGLLWGARARDWAENEERQRPTYEEALRRVALSSGAAVLEVGCGSGVFLRLAADRGARVSGLDASGELVELARERVPGADVRVGDLQFLPYADDIFDLVCGFNSFFFATDMVAALREARRVARPGATVVIQVWGRPEQCDGTAMKRAVSALADGPASPPPELWRPGALEALAAEAGLTPATAFDLRYPIGYVDEPEAVRLMLSVGLFVEAAGRFGEQAVRDAIVSSLAPYRDAGGGYRLANEWHFLLATA